MKRRIKAYLITREGFSRVMDLDSLTPRIRIAKVPHLKVGVWEEASLLPNTGPDIISMEFILEDEVHSSDVTIAIYREM